MKNEDLENEELNNEVVKVIFGIPQDQKDAWPWAIPEFSTDRNYCCQVILHMFVHEAHQSLIPTMLFIVVIKLFSDFLPIFKSLNNTFSRF